MNIHKNYTGFAIAIAWPETWCKQSGAWYDGFIHRLGIGKHRYYKVGHAALILVDDKSGKCHYFDFGRYHAPFQHGRVRSEATDDGLKIQTTAQISADKKRIENFGQILKELQENPECHGDGHIHASYGRIEFEKAFEKAVIMQQNSPIPYGPFIYGGSNCSRFVNKVIMAGNPSWLAAFKLRLLVPLTPTPLNNVNAFKNKHIYPKLLPFTFTPKPISDKRILAGTLNKPERAVGIPPFAQWLSGEGAGSWFAINELERGKYSVSRFSPDGKKECEGEFIIVNNQSFAIELPFSFDYLSHCRQIRIRQNNELIEFVRITELKESNLLNKKMGWLQNELYLKN